MLSLSCIYAQQYKADIKFNGFADTYHAIRSNEPYDFMSSRSRLRAEVQVLAGKSYLFASLNASYNGIIDNQTKLELREAYFQYSENFWEIKAGRQIVIWGVADGLRITDLISPMDYTEFLARDYDDIRLPVDAVKLKYIRPNWSIEAIFVPVPSFFIIPIDSNNPWSFCYGQDVQYCTDQDNTPDKKLSNSEYGLRLAAWFAGIDLSFAALHTWNKMPLMEMKYSSHYDSLIFQSDYAPMDMLGMDLSKTIGSFVLRAEAAYYFNELMEGINGDKLRKNSVNGLLGMDWYPGNDFTIMMQYYRRSINAKQQQLAVKRNSDLLTLRISKKILRSTMDISTFAYADLNYSSFFCRSSVDYALSDQIHLMVGYDWFSGDNGMFAPYKNNSEYWFKAKYSF